MFSIPTILSADSCSVIAVNPLISVNNILTTLLSPPSDVPSGDSKIHSTISSDRYFPKVFFINLLWISSFSFNLLSLFC